MKAELIYLWINRDEHGCFQQEGFNFSPHYRVSYNQDTKELIIKQLEQLNVFQNDHIANVSAVIGENGTGKTTLLEYLTTFDDVPLSDEQRPEYQPFRRNQNELRSFIAVYLDHEDDSRRIINITNDTIFCNGESFEPFSNAEYRAGNNLLEKISRIYLSNSSYSQTQGAQTRGTISNISITDNALPAIFRAFYMKKYGRESDQPANQNTPFNTLITILAEKEDSKTMQMFIDLLFCTFLLQSGKPFRGKHINKILFSFKNAQKMLEREMDINYSADNARQDRFAQVKEKWLPIAQSINAESTMGTIVCNLAFELFFVFDAFSIAAPENESLTADTLLSECETFIDALDECTERTYYRSAVNEIKLIERIVERAEISSNLLPREDLGRQTWVMANTGAFIPIINQIKRGCSFVLKYLAIDNFGVSSGERALLNYMSRLYFASQINDFIPNSGFVWNESVLLLIDEIDLYLHPEWQRQILNDFLTAIQEYFPHSYFQIIITSHSPIVLSDIPHENSIFLRKDGDKIVQDKHTAQTFGANIHTLYRDAFFIKDGVAIGAYAKDKINAWITEFKENSISEEEMQKKIALIGEPIIQRRLEQIAKRHGINSIAENIRRDERQSIIDFLKAQQAALQHQIQLLEAERR